MNKKYKMTEDEFLQLREKFVSKFREHKNSEKLIEKIYSIDDIDELGELEEYLHWESLLLAFNSYSDK